MAATNLECLLAMVACAKGIGVPRGSGMFRQALRAIAFLSQDKITAKVDYLKNTFRWSDAEVGIAISKAPTLLTRNKESLQRSLVEKVFVEKFICPYKEVAQHLAEDYAAACRGEVPTRLRFA
ncbi:unnamed protein product [Triticum turgidum subsp. durum]|uniref:Uncharacterized protein n=1 Tax=Triticum turgidum subsp. durum TaxID=4567 RepID=A0A9R0YV52_TRITD|nr:unnamed protein product [Triticum turgidum subsp. durum]